MTNGEYKVLLIEDDIVDQRAFQRFISENDIPYDYTIAGSMREGRRLLETQTFDVVLCDYILGDGTGLDILDLKLDIPVIMVTGSGDEEVAAKAMRAGARDYLIKDPPRNYLKLLPATVEIVMKQKRVENALRKSEALLTETGKMAKIGGWEVEVETLKVSWTEETYRIHEVPVGHKPPLEEAINFFHPDDRSVLETAIQKAVEHGEPYDMELRFITARGKHLWTRTMCNPITVNGKVVRLLGAFQDITERKKDEEALLDSEQHYRTLFDESPVPIWVEDFSEVKNNIDLLKQEGITDFRAYFEEHPEKLMEYTGMVNIFEVNKPVLELFEAESKEDLFKGLADVFTEESFSIFLEELIAIAEGKTECEFEGSAKTLTGKTKHIHLKWVVVQGYEETMERVYVSTIDITERKRFEEERSSMEAQLRQSQKLEAIGTLAGGAAHEINNPLQGILSYATLIQEGVGETELKEFTEEIKNESLRIAGIVKNLLSFARQDEGSHSPARICDIVHTPLRLFGSMFRKHQITVETNIPDEIPDIRCRSQQIEQVMIKLLTNARDALNQRYQGWHEDKLIRISAKTFQKDGVEWVRTTVEDHGTGIPEEIMNRIFDPFFTTKERGKGPASSAAPPGTGLGLSVSHGIITDHHGRLWVESEEGEYTRFHIDLRVDNGWSVKGAEKEMNDRDAGEREQDVLHEDESRDEGESKTQNSSGETAAQPRGRKNE